MYFVTFTTMIGKKNIYWFLVASSIYEDWSVSYFTITIFGEVRVNRHVSILDLRCPVTCLQRLTLMITMVSGLLWFIVEPSWFIILSTESAQKSPQMCPFRCLAARHITSMQGQPWHAKGSPNLSSLVVWFSLIILTNSLGMLLVCFGVVSTYLFQNIIELVSRRNERTSLYIDVRDM